MDLDEHKSGGYGLKGIVLIRQNILVSKLQKQNYKILKFTALTTNLQHLRVGDKNRIVGSI